MQHQNLIKYEVIATLCPQVYEPIAYQLPRRDFRSAWRVLAAPRLQESAILVAGF